MRKALLSIAVLTTLVTTSCKKEDKTSVTQATITVTSAKGPVSGITVYAFDQTTWDVIGNIALHAKGQASSDASGQAVFSNLEYPTVFNDINNDINNFRFSVFYNINGRDKSKYIPVTIKKGDHARAPIFLD